MTPATHHSQIRRPSLSAESQRTTCDAGRSARALPHVRSIYPPGSVAGTKRSTTRDPVDGESGRHYSARQAPCTGRLLDRNRQTVVTGAAATFSSWLGQRRGNTRDTGVASRSQTWSPSAELRPVVKRGSVGVPSARSIYPSRAGLAAAICASWAIALAAGVALALEIFG